MSEFRERAREHANENYGVGWDPYEEEPVDDYGFSEAQRQAFMAGADWAFEYLRSGDHEEDPLSDLSTVRELTTKAAADMRESMKILYGDEKVDLDTSFDLAKMVVEHRMRVMGERY